MSTHSNHRGFLGWAEDNLSQETLDTLVQKARENDCAVATVWVMEEAEAPANNFAYSTIIQVLQRVIRTGYSPVSYLGPEGVKKDEIYLEDFKARLLAAESEQEESTPRYGRRQIEEIGGGAYRSDVKVPVSDLSQDPSERERQLITGAGFDPDEYSIDGPIKSSRWEAQVAGGGIEEMGAYKFTLAPRADSLPGFRDEDIKRVAEELRGISRPYAPEGSQTLLWHVSDTQLGKRENGGVEGLDSPLRHVLEGLQQVRLHLMANPGRYSDVVVAVTGDCVEGISSQNGRLQGYRTLLTEADQRKVLYRTFVEIIKSLAPYAPKLVLGVVNGNHDRAGGRVVDTCPGDGLATHAAEIAAEIVEASAIETGHVQVVIPHREQSWLTYQAEGGTILMLHGDQFKNATKQVEWLANAALMDSDAAAADVVVYGHWHSKNLIVQGPRTFCCASTVDGGSQWFSDRRGGAWQQPQSEIYTVTGGRIIETKTIFTEATTGKAAA